LNQGFLEIVSDNKALKFTKYKLSGKDELE